MNEALMTRLRAQDGVRCLALNQGSPLVLASLGSLADVTYAVGQMTCLVAALFQRKLGAGYSGWETSDGSIPAEISVNELYRLVSEVQSPVVQAAAHAAWLGWWPAGSSAVSGFESVKIAMAEIGHVLFNTSAHPMSTLTGSKPHSLGVRVKEALKDFAAAGGGLHNEALFYDLLERLGRTVLVAAHDVNVM